MLARNNGQRVFLVEGRPWMDAVIAYLEPRSPYKPWRVPRGMSAGDLIVTVLHTDPRTVLCVERLGPNRRSGDLDVVEEYEMNLPLVSGVEARAGITLRGTPGPIDDDSADRLLHALSAYEGWHPWLFDEPRWDDWQPSTAEAARVLVRSRGCCAACGEEVDLRGARARDRVHVHLAEAPARDEVFADRPAALCAACRKAMTDGGFATFVDFRFSLQPQCPRCEAFRTREVVYGMPPGPGWLDDQPWMSEGGCVVSEESYRWACGACGYGWHHTVDPRFDDDRSPRAGDYISAHLFNFDGRRAHMFPPDVDNSHELQTGILIIEAVDSAWGEYTRYAIRCDDGRLREIEPDTIYTIHGMRP